MSYELWQKLPENFLKMKYEAFAKLGGDVKRLIVELASEQKFKCVFCPQQTDLEVEHEHEPNEKVPYSIYNVRGLVCRKCNWHLMTYESQERGHTVFENFTHSHIVCDSEYEDYNYLFECRVRAWHEAVLQKQMGHRYWRRKLKLDILDARYEEGRFPWQQDPHWILHASLKDPNQVIEIVFEIFKFAREQFDKDPNFTPPEEFWKLYRSFRQIVGEVLSAKGSASKHQITTARV